MEDGSGLGSAFCQMVRGRQDFNASYNCLDRHLTTWRKNKAALIWEGEPGDSRVLTYQDLHREVCRFANVLKSFGIRTGDRVAIYMPMVPELPIALLACARIGATQRVKTTRRVLGRGAEGSDQRCQGQAPDYCGRRIPKGSDCPLERKCGQGARGCAQH